MDIEGFVRARIDDYDYNDLADILAVRIREYKKISENYGLFRRFVRKYRGQAKFVLKAAR